MKNSFTRIILLCAVSIIFADGFPISVFAKSKNPVKTKTDVKLKSSAGFNKADKTAGKARENSISSPILFEENRGQFARNIKFASRAADYNFYLTQAGAVFSMPNLKQPEKSPFILNMKMLGANMQSEIKGIEEAVTKSSYFIGNDQTKWLSEISNFQKIKIHRIYEGIDLIFRSSEQKLEYDFQLAPEADPNLIDIEFEGIKKVEIDLAGNLVFRFRGIKLHHQKPFAYQIIDGERREINVKYKRSGKNRIGFKIGEYDKSKELIIDPVVYASYLGGTAGGDSVNDIAVDRDGNVYTASDVRIPFPEINSTYSDVMISKFDLSKPPNEQLLWVKYIGGAQDEVPYATVTETALLKHL